MRYDHIIQQRILSKGGCLLLGMVLLLVLNCAKEEALPVTANFRVVVLDDDYSIPVIVSINNLTEGGESFLWDFGNGIPAGSTEENPGTIIYNEHGTYTIRLEASNDDGSFDSKEITVTLADAITIDFEPIIIDNNYAPMEVQLDNTTTGATSYSWTFEGGTPSSSDVQYPTNILFSEPGDHLITLEVSNGQDIEQIQKTVTVAPYLEAFFSYEPIFEDDDLEVPVTITTTNQSISATQYNWTVIGTTTTLQATEENPTFVLEDAGTYSINLSATNGKETKNYTQNITLSTNTNLRTIEDIQLGINTAHNSNSIGAFFSTTTREVYNSEEIDDTNGPLIDLVFFGLNDTFSFNKFLSPDEADTTTFETIPNATHTKVINLQESCSCSASLSVLQFDEMNDDTILSSLDIEETAGGLEDFDNSVVPRIVLFENANGIKGAIKIKEYIADGQNSYIRMDLKMQKEAN